MQFAYQITVFLHLVGFAALLGGVLVQLRVPDPEVNRAMLVGALLELVTGAGLWVLAGLDSSPVSIPQLVVKSIITVFIAIVGGLIGGALFGVGMRGFFHVSTWLLAIAGSLLVLFLWGLITKRRTG